MKLRKVSEKIKLGKVSVFANFFVILRLENLLNYIMHLPIRNSGQHP